jgi:uncharacterized damage-inducible protein DinB
MKDQRRELKMKKLTILCLLTVVSFSAGALAQAAGGTAPAQTQAAKPAPSVASSVDREVGIIEREFVSAAEAMPEDKYNFTPEALNLQGSDYKGVRTFAQQVKHVAATNFGLWAAVTGDKPAYDLSDDNGPASIKTKADIVKFLKESFEAGHKAAKSLTPQNSSETVTTFFGPTAKIFAVTFTVAHGFDHYGQIVEYLRMNGIIPPASRPQK